MGATRGAIGVCVVALALSTFLVSVHGQSPTSVAPASEFVFPICDGVEVVYVLEKAREIYPKSPSAAKQAHMFVAHVTLTNLGYSTLDTWGVGLSYSHQEILTDAGTLQLENGNALPAAVSAGAVFSLSPPQPLRNAIETGGDLTKMAQRFRLVGAEFGEPLFPMPVTLNITTPRYECTTPKIYGNSTMRTCCTGPVDDIKPSGDDSFFQFWDRIRNLF